MPGIFVAAVFLATLMIGVPVAYVIGITVWVYLTQSGIPQSLLAVRMSGGLTSFPLVAVPLFIFAANLMMEGGSSRRLIDLCLAAAGWIRGGLAQVNVLISVLFAGVSGAALSDAASMGTWLIPAMKERRYSPAYSAAVTAASSTFSPVIPPSISIIVAGIIAEESIVKLFMAGIMPGLAMGVAVMGVSYFLAVRHNHPVEGRFNWGNLWRSLRAGTLDLVLPILIVGGIRFGWFTPTEGSAIAVAYVLLLGCVIHREITLKSIARAAVSTVTISGSVLVMVGLASSLGWVITLERIPEWVASLIGQLDAPGWVLMLALAAGLLAIGTVMDGFSALIVFLPVLLPLGSLMGMEPIQMITFVNLALVLGVLTPPVGVCLFITSSIAGVDILKVARAAVPFVLVLTVVLLIVGFYQPMTMWLPSLGGG